MNLNEVILTSGITDICDNAFQNSSLTQITIPNSRQEYWIHAFGNCSSLTTVDISMTDSSLSSIGSYAFTIVMIYHKLLYLIMSLILVIIHSPIVQN